MSAHRELMDLLEQEREREFEMRSDLRKEIWKTLESERSAERSEKSNVKTEEVGASIFMRIRAWKELRQKVKQLRAERNAEIMELRWKERENEEKLGPGDVPDRSGKKE